MTDSPDRAEPTGEHPPRSSPNVTRSLDQLWIDFEPDHGQGYGLLPDLPFDAVMVRAGSGEALACTPRLVELLVEHRLSVIEARQVMDLVGSLSLRADRELAVQGVLEAWWVQALRRDGPEQAAGYPPAVVLGLVARWPSPMTRWFGPWIGQLDGPGARHLVDAVAALELPSPPPPVDPDLTWVVSAPLVVEAWRGVDDRRGQFLGWARSETVVNGLVLVGATHLHSDHYPELLSDIVDLLLEG